MNIRILQLIDGARNAKGLTVVIDVFRAFTVSPYLFKNNAHIVYPVGSVEKAFDLKNNNAGSILIGERNEMKVPGFDFGNSPSQIIDFDFTGKTVIHTTSSGTQGLINSIHANEVLTGSFVNADAIVRYIKKKNPSEVSLVCMGYACEYPIEEDTFCAEYIKNALEGKTNDFTKMVEVIKNTSGQRFFDPAKASFSPTSDFYMCMKTGVFDFVLQAQKINDDQMQLTKIYVPY